MMNSFDTKIKKKKKINSTRKKHLESNLLACLQFTMASWKKFEMPFQSRMLEFLNMTIKESLPSVISNNNNSSVFIEQILTLALYSCAWEVWWLHSGNSVNKFVQKCVSE